MKKSSFAGAIVVAAFLSMNAYADTASVESLNTACRQSGGMPEQMQLIIMGGKTGFVPSGSPRSVCLFSANGRLSVIATDTLESTYPSLAATAYRNAPALTFSNGNGDQRWDVTYCQHLGGTVTIGQGLSGAYAQNAGGNEFPICMFADGSAIDTWSLFYKRETNTPAVDFTSLFKSDVLDIAPAALWGK